MELFKNRGYTPVELCILIFMFVMCIIVFCSVLFIVLGEEAIFLLGAIVSMIVLALFAHKHPFL